MYFNIDCLNSSVRWVQSATQNQRWKEFTPATATSVLLSTQHGNMYFLICQCQAKAHNHTQMYSGLYSTGFAVRLNAKRNEIGREYTKILGSTLGWLPMADIRVWGVRWSFKCFWRLSPWLRHFYRLYTDSWSTFVFATLQIKLVFC